MNHQAVRFTLQPRLTKLYLLIEILRDTQSYTTSPVGSESARHGAVGQMLRPIAAYVFVDPSLLSNLSRSGCPTTVSIAARTSSNDFDQVVQALERRKRSFEAE